MNKQNIWTEHSKKKDRIPGENILRRKTEYLDRLFQEERQNTWREHPKKKDRIPE